MSALLPQEHQIRMRSDERDNLRYFLITAGCRRGTMLKIEKTSANPAPGYQTCKWFNFEAYLSTGMKQVTGLNCFTQRVLFLLRL